jgi:hypothetical protein
MMGNETPTGEPTTETPEALHDAAIAATEAWQANPTDELKVAAKSAVEKAKAAATKAKEEAASKAKAEAEQRKQLYPDKFVLKAPEESGLDATQVEEIAAYAKAQGFSQTQAQALVDREARLRQTWQDGQAALLEQKQAEWLASAKADKEFGGEGFAKNSELAKRVVHRFGSEALKQALEESGLGNHPELVRLLVRIGSAMGEDTLVTGAPSGKGPTAPEDVLYGKPTT